MECLKARTFQGQPPDLNFWRDSAGLEVDLLRLTGDDLHPVEIKSGQTLAKDFFDGLRRWAQLADQTTPSPWLVYGGDRELQRDGIAIIPWRRLPHWLEAEG